MILGAYSPKYSNNDNNVFATDLVQGNSVILEYYEPEYSNDGIINISNVIHGYINLFRSDTNQSPGLGNSEYCNVDINCPLGDI